jgi:hypothetical protein
LHQKSPEARHDRPDTAGPRKSAMNSFISIRAVFMPAYRSSGILEEIYSFYTKEQAKLFLPEPGKPGK